MFKCKHCGRVTRPREPGHRVVLKTRRKVYENKVGYETKTSVGYEIVKEALFCGKCAKRHEKQQQEESWKSAPEISR